jgi:hypothetical protein
MLIKSIGGSVSIVLNDQQTKDISKEILLLPFVINDPVTGYVGQKAALQTSADNLLLDDENKELFYNFWKDDVILKYHNELQQLNADLKTNYLNSYLIDGGFQRGVHYPNNNPSEYTWLSPKLIPSMNGNPVTPNSIATEQDRIDDVQTYIDYLKTGFNDGIKTSSVTGVTATQFTVNTGVSPAIGDRVVIHSGGNSLFGLVTNVSGALVDYTFLGGTLVGSGTCDTFHNGFSNLERAHSSSNYADDVMYYFESELDAAVASWHTNLTTQKTNLDTNGDYAPRKAGNVLASGNCLFALNYLNSFQALAYNSRFIDSGLLLLETIIPIRSPQIPTRIAVIISNLGSVVQNPDGSFSGSGVYLLLAEVLNSRISRTGSLCSYNKAFLGLAYFDKLIYDSNAQLDQYELTMVVKTITEDVAAFDLTVKVDDITQLNLGDSVKIFDNDSIVYVRTISGISGLDVTLNTAIPVSLVISKLARLVKVL